MLICSQSCVTITHYVIPAQFHHPKKKPLSVSSHSSDRCIILVPILQMWKQAQSPEAHPEPPSELRGRAGYWAVPRAPWGDGSVWEAFERMSTYWPEGGPSPNLSRCSALRPSPLALQSQADRAVSPQEGCPQRPVLPPISLIHAGLVLSMLHLQNRKQFHVHYVLCKQGFSSPALLTFRVR